MVVTLELMEKSFSLRIELYTNSNGFLLCFTILCDEESVGLPQTITLRKNTAAHDAPGTGQKPGHGAVKDSNTPGNVFLLGIPTDSWWSRMGVMRPY